MSTPHRARGLIFFFIRPKPALPERQVGSRCIDGWGLYNVIVWVLQVVHTSTLTVELGRHRGRLTQRSGKIYQRHTYGYFFQPYGATELADHACDEWSHDLFHPLPTMPRHVPGIHQSGSPSPRKIEKTIEGCAAEKTSIRVLIQSAEIV
jgi:hypothetical protein